MPVMFRKFFDPVRATLIYGVFHGSLWKEAFGKNRIEVGLEELVG